MQIKPRQHLLDIWQAVSRHSSESGEWDWGEGGGLSSVADTERLLCLMYPATEIAEFRLDDPDTMECDVQTALKNVGGRTEIPAKLVRILAEFMDTYTAEDEGPSFAGGHYFDACDPGEELTEEQRRVGVVDSFSMSITLTETPPWSLAPPAQSAWMRTCDQDLHRLAADRGVGHSAMLGSVPLEPVLQWREQLITDEDVLSSRVAGPKTLKAFQDLAGKLTDTAAWGMP